MRLLLAVTNPSDSLCGVLVVVYEEEEVVMCMMQRLITVVLMEVYEIEDV